MSRVIIFNAHGVGDAILSFKVASFIENDSKALIDIISCTRNEVCEPLYYLFGDRFNLKQHILREQWGENNWIVDNIKEVKATYPNYDEYYYVIPDLLFRAKQLSFDYKKYNTHPQLIKQTRILTHKWQPTKRIFVGLATSTPGYLYDNVGLLLRDLAQYNPDREIYFPKLDHWAGVRIDYGNLSDMPHNVTIKESPNFIESIDALMASEYSITTDNGFMHLSYELGIRHLILDPRYGNNRNVIWQARWRPSMENSIPIQSHANMIARLVRTNLEVEQTNMINKNFVLNNLNSDWSRELLFKF